MTCEEPSQSGRRDWAISVGEDEQDEQEEQGVPKAPITLMESQH